MTWVTPERAEAVDAALRLAEETCLNTALLGVVIAHEADGHVNKLKWGEFGVTAENNAGWPEARWLPPSHLDARAEDVVRSRTRRAKDQDRTVDWAR